MRKIADGFHWLNKGLIDGKAYIQNHYARIAPMAMNLLIVIPGTTSMATAFAESAITLLKLSAGQRSRLFSCFVMAMRGSMSNYNLTEQQSNILVFIKSYAHNNGYPPTRADIAKHFKFKSVNAAQEHLVALNRKGWIELVPGVARGIRLV